MFLQMRLFSFIGTALGCHAGDPGSRVTVGQLVEQLSTDLKVTGQDTETL